MKSDPAIAKAYRDAWEMWLRQAERLHSVLLGGEDVAPSRLKGILSSEAKAKDVYEEARAQLLGLNVEDDSPPQDSSNPFRR